MYFSVEQNNKQVTMLDLFLRTEAVCPPDIIVTQAGLAKVQEEIKEHIRNQMTDMLLESNWQEAWDNRDPFILPRVFHLNYQK